MHKNRKLYADTFCDVYSLIEPWVDDHFWDFEQFDPEPGSICVVGRKQTVENTQKVKDLCEADVTMIFANSAEGSTTQIAQLQVLGLEQLVKNGRLLLLTGGRMSDQYPHLLHEHFLVRILMYDTNLEQMKHTADIFSGVEKPYKFLFLNGRARPHRKYLLERLRQSGNLDQALWTMLDGRGSSNRDFQLCINGEDVMRSNTAITLLPTQYEVDRYRGRRLNTDYPHQNCKMELFNNEWGEIYLEKSAYVDTYFSLVTETVYESDHSFFTEKIAKPLAMGHPWIAATNRGFYRDIKNLGFRTFDHVIDEAFDQIDNAQDRMDRILTVVHDLCRQDLKAFLRAVQDTCIYNQCHLHDAVHRENSTFAQRFFQFIDAHERS